MCSVIMAGGDAVVMTSDKTKSTVCHAKLLYSEPNNNDMPGLCNLRPDCDPNNTPGIGHSTVEVIACEAWADLAAIDNLVAAITPVSRQALANHYASRNEWLGPTVHEHGDSAEEMSGKCLLQREP